MNILHAARMNKFLVIGLFFFVASAVSFRSQPDDRDKNIAIYSHLLTKQTWVYSEFFQHFNEATTTLAWKANRTGNSLNLFKKQIKFNDDNTCIEVDENGKTVEGTWTFLNNASQIQVTNSTGTFVSTIQVLTRNRFEWLAANGDYGVMTPRYQAISFMGNLLQMLTSKPWIYTEYFKNYDKDNTLLVWKINKGNSMLKLSRNIVQFNSNGAYSEITEDGTALKGTWTFLNNQTQVKVINGRGTFIVTLKHLSTDRLEWLSDDGKIYGEMAH